MLQLVIKFGAVYLGEIVDLVVAHYDEGADVRMAEFPGCELVPWAGSLAGLQRIGPAPLDPTCDCRPYAAPVDIDLVAYAKARKKLVETGGILLNGSFVDTSITSQNRLANADTYLMRSGDTEVTFEAADGTSISMPAETLTTISLAVGRHVQACFKTLGQVKTAVAAGTITTVAQVRAAFAPLALPA